MGTENSWQAETESASPMIPWQVGWGGERGGEWGLTGVEFASSSAVFHALQSKPQQTMRREFGRRGMGPYTLDIPLPPSL